MTTPIKLIEDIRIFTMVLTYMGIKHLNQYLLKHCSPDSIKKIGLEDLRGKTIVVDISIYIYKFLTDGSYMEHLYFFLGLFYHYQITPIFIFDGKPPPEKWDLIKKRRQDKKAAELEYNDIMKRTNNDNNIDLQDKLDSLKKRMVTLKDANLVDTKRLIDVFGFSYFEAKGEADELCAYFVLSGIAWACLTDDMDMFLYGCPRILRNMSMMKKEVVLYSTEAIITDLRIESLYDFTQILVLLGTDYSAVCSIGIKQALDYYYEYKESIIDTSMNLYYWIENTYKCIQETVFLGLMDPFISVLQKAELHIYKDLYMKQTKGSFQIEKIQEMMGPYGFIFI